MEGGLIYSKRSISFLDGIDRTTGVITDKNSDVVGESIAGKTLRLEAVSGSTVGVYTLFELAQNSVAPMEIILGMPDSNIITGAVVLDIPISVEGVERT